MVGVSVIRLVQTLGGFDIEEMPGRNFFFNLVYFNSSYLRGVIRICYDKGLISWHNNVLP